MSISSVALDGHSAITPQMIHSLVSEAAKREENRSCSTGEEELQIILDRTVVHFKDGVDPRKVLHHLITDISELKKTLSLTAWQALSVKGREHPVMEYLLEDMFTRWSIEKPRGYSGDAGLIDFIYYHPSVAAHVAAGTDFGRTLYEYTTATAPGVACRERKEFLAKIIDKSAKDHERPIDVMTVACGNLREAAVSDAFHNDGIGRWLALDQDPICVEGIAENYEDTVIEPREGSVRTVLQKGHTFGTFDLVYATGLYDYLIDKVAIKLTKKCLSMLNPGGKFVFAQYATGLVEGAYMDMFMNWALILREMGDVERILEKSVEGEDGTYSWKAYFGVHNTVIYAEITRVS
ncbi:class I SAM-dependent methyltransferase [Rhizobium sp. MHM7A]|uniref:class I SAM-dependent methyltransferase n=1 Tax=Rhizobium sp. MHM7A TaxID=2583233 RepID=UPI001105C250|nr:class I SAM-dependent methyltransferase [Rhizobium sp. MHM7A]TLX16576.1 class I SAM-dependent methyltransferase [Rhizobium sp. MHM7A]